MAIYIKLQAIYLRLGIIHKQLLCSSMPPQICLFNPKISGDDLTRHYEHNKKTVCKKTKSATDESLFLLAIRA